MFKHKEHAESISCSAELGAPCRAHLEAGSQRQVGTALPLPPKTPPPTSRAVGRKKFSTFSPVAAKLSDRNVLFVISRIPRSLQRRVSSI